MSFLQKFKPTLYFLTALGICPFSINCQFSQIQLSMKTFFLSIIGSLIFMILFIINTYIAIFADKSIQQIFSTILQISITAEIFFYHFIYIFLLLLTIGAKYKHANLLNQLNEIDLKLVQICRKELYVKCYLRHQIILLITLYMCNVLYIMEFQFDFDEKTKVLCIIYLWGIITTYFMILYVRYIGRILLNVQKLLIEKVQLDINNNSTIIQWKWLKMLNLWDALNDAINVYVKTFGVHLQLCLLLNYEVIVSTLYRIIINLLYSQKILFILFFCQLYYISTAVIVIVYMVIGLNGLSNQVSF